MVDNIIAYDTNDKENNFHNLIGYNNSDESVISMTSSSDSEILK